MADTQLITSHVRYEDIRGFPDYRVGDDGSVWTRKVRGSYTGQIGDWWQLKPLRVNKAKRVQVHLRLNGKEYWRAIHRLVLEAFVGPCPDGMEACHRDDDQSNNRLDNLRWDTHANNCFDRSRNGIHVGETHSRSLLNNEKVREIRKLRAKGMTYAAIGRIMGVSPSAIHAIVSGRLWKHVI